MRFALADLKKTIFRRGGEPRIVPHLLRPGELARELGDLIALYESWLGRERMDFPSDRAAELIGDYRLARCLEQCLGEWYEWQSPPWPGPASPALAASLAPRGIASASQLRLALYDFVNARFGGYLGETSRDAALAAFAGELGIPVPILDLLLALDSDLEAILRRIALSAPRPEELAARYNQRAVEALLANAASVEWELPADWSGESGEGLGTVVKRICFLARRMGVHYDLTFADDATSPSQGERSGEGSLPRVAEEPATYGATPSSRLSLPAEERSGEGSLDACGRPLVVTFYGPQELTGAPNQYGERLARLCRALLGYRRQGERKGALAGGTLRGAARIYLHGRPLLFTLDDRLLHLLRSQGEGDDATPLGMGGIFTDAIPAVPGGEPLALTFDSSLEARLHAEFAALEVIGETHGWHLEHEPAPLLAEGLILVPDFALSRGSRRVYLEIAGYWRPGYRERKARKLAALRGRVEFLLAAPIAAHAEFASVGEHIGLLWYEDAVSVQALLTLLDRDYNDFAERLAALEVPRLRARVAAHGRIPPPEAQNLLGCYTRAEVASAVRALAQSGEGPAPEWVEGVGLCSTAWLDGVQARLLAEVTLSSPGCMSLGSLRSALVAAEPALADLDQMAIETLSLRAGLRIRRTSIFEAMVALSDEQADPTVSTAPLANRRAQPRPRSRRTPSRAEHFAAPPLFAPDGSDD